MSKYYINSFPYEVELTARLCHENARRLLEKITTDITIDEFTVLDTVIAKPGLSQADLARLILKGKAHTGRFLMALEDKGLVERHVEERGGKLIKVASATDYGYNLYKDILSKLKPSIKAFENAMSEEEISKIQENLKKFREAIETASKIVFE